MEISFTERELDVMGVLWDLGSGTVSEVRERLADPLAYTTVLSVLRTLEEKGFVGHEEEGKAHRYFPRVEQEAASRSALGRVVRKLFRGSPEQLVAQLVSDRSLSNAGLRRIRALLDRQLREGSRGGGREG